MDRYYRIYGKRTSANPVVSHSNHVVAAAASSRAGPSQLCHRKQKLFPFLFLLPWETHRGKPRRLFIRIKSSFQANIRLIYASLLIYHGSFFLLRPILFPWGTRGVWWKTVFWPSVGAQLRWNGAVFPSSLGLLPADRTVALTRWSFPGGRAKHGRLLSQTTAQPRLLTGAIAKITRADPGSILSLN